MSKQTRPEDFLPLKPHWFHVMLSLADQDQHGYGIMQEVRKRTEGKVRLWPATLYGTLKRLMDEGFIEESASGQSPKRTMRGAAITGSRN
jgi:DNA-binding PadR family transcriptional regulator